MASREFGEAVARERVTHGIRTRAKLEEALGDLDFGAVTLPAGTMDHIETGRRHPGPAVFDALARLFGWGPSEFRRLHTLAYRGPELVEHDAAVAFGKVRR